MIVKLCYFLILIIPIKIRVLLPIDRFLVFDFRTRVLLPINSFLFLSFGIFMRIRVLLLVNALLFFDFSKRKLRFCTKFDTNFMHQIASFATGKSRWLSRNFFYTNLRIATSGHIFNFHHFKDLNFLSK